MAEPTEDTTTVSAGEVVAAEDSVTTEPTAEVPATESAIPDDQTLNGTPKPITPATKDSPERPSSTTDNLTAEPANTSPVPQTDTRPLSSAGPSAPQTATSQQADSKADAVAADVVPTPTPTPQPAGSRTTTPRSIKSPSGTPPQPPKTATPEGPKASTPPASGSTAATPSAAQGTLISDKLTMILSDTI